MSGKYFTNAGISILYPKSFRDAQNNLQHHDVKTANKSLGNVADKIFGTTVTNQNYIPEEVKVRFNTSHTFIVQFTVFCPPVPSPKT
jgi:hypothetical protein